MIVTKIFFENTPSKLDKQYFYAYTWLCPFLRVWLRGWSHPFIMCNRGVNMANSIESLENSTESLFNEQKRTLDLFLERGAISKEQYDVSLHTLIEKMKK